MEWALAGVMSALIGAMYALMAAVGGDYDV